MLKQTYIQKIKDMFLEVPDAVPVQKNFLWDMVELIEDRPGTPSKRRLYTHYVSSDVAFFSIVKTITQSALVEPMPDREAAAYAELYDYAVSKLADLGCSP